MFVCSREASLNNGLNLDSAFFEEGKVMGRGHDTRDLFWEQNVKTVFLLIEGKKNLFQSVLKDFVFSFFCGLMLCNFFSSCDLLISLVNV